MALLLSHFLPARQGARLLNNPAQSGFGRWLALAAIGIALGTVPARAIERTLTITAPTTVVAGSNVQVTANASTDAKDAEQIGFLHAEYSIAGGQTWKGFCYDTKIGKSANRSATVTVGAAGSTTIVRVRVAFRGAGRDVDFAGKPIAWDGSWKTWGEPPAKVAKITVTAPAK